jgi:hypothetical protein
VLGASFGMIEKPTMQKVIEQQDYDLLASELLKIKQLIDKLRADKYPNVDFAKASLAQVSQVTGRDFNVR